MFGFGLNVTEGRHVLRKVRDAASHFCLFWFFFLISLCLILFFFLISGLSSAI
jgi:hypothetical protein